MYTIKKSILIVLTELNANHIFPSVHSLYRSPNIVRVNKLRRLRWADRIARVKECRSNFEIFTGKPRKRILGMCRWDNIRKDLREIGVSTRTARYRDAT